MFPHDEHSTYMLPKEGERCYVCVGSVGQPRDRDWRASFATIDGDRIMYHRVTYDLNATQTSILGAGLHPFLAERLRKGI